MQQLLDQTDDAIADVSEYIEEYEAFNEWVIQAESDFDEFNESEQVAFVDAFSQFEQYTEELVPPDEVVEVRADMREIFRDPLLQAILDAIQDVCGRLGLSLSESVTESFENEMQSWSRSHLIECREAYDDIDLAIEDLSSSERAYIRDKIDNKPHRLLEPESEVIPELDSVSETAARLREITSVFDTYDWLSLEGRHIGPFLRSWLGAEAPAPTDVESVMDSLDESINTLGNCGIPAADPVSAEIDLLTEHPQDDFLDELQGLSSALEKEAIKAEPLLHTSDIIEEIEGLGLETLNQDELVHISEILEESDPGSLNRVIEIVSEAREEYSDWVREITSRWRTYHSAVAVLSQYTAIEEPDRFSNQEEFTDALFEEPLKAIRSLGELASTLEENRQTVGDQDGLGEESIQLLFELIEQQEVSYEAYSQETIEELNEVIALQIRIDE